MRAVAVVLALALAGCHAAPRRPAPTTGTIVGLVRDGATGETLAQAEIVLRADGQLEKRATAYSTTEGFYELDRLPPGRYAITAYFAGEVVEITNISIAAGRSAPVDIAFQLGRATPLTVDFANSHEGAIARYTPRNADPRVGLIEGTVTDSATRERVPGAVVTAIESIAGRAAGEAAALQAVTDDHGRFRFAHLTPGTYVVSAYYTIERRGQIEVQRNSLELSGGEALIVPLWVELEQ